MRYVILLIVCAFSVPAFAAGGTCPSGANYLNPANPTGSLVTLSSLGITSCYYFSKSTGADANAGTTEASPQAHLPCMPSYTGSLASTLNAGAAGLGFIMRGGETWTNGDMQCSWFGPGGGFQNWGGNSSNPVYIGADLTWWNSGVCGGSFCRPIWTCGGSACSVVSNGDGYYKDTSSTQYVLIDEINFTGLFQGTGNNPQYVNIFGNHYTVTRNYAHGWTHTGTLTANNNTIAFGSSQCCGGGLIDNFFFNVVDPSDTINCSSAATDGIGSGFGGNPNIVAYNYMACVVDGVQGSMNQVHDNVIGPLVFVFTTGGAHQNALQQAGPAGASNTFFYNNAMTGVPSGGMADFWLGQAGGGNPQTAYVFNNVMYTVAAGNNVNPCQSNSGSCGTFWIFNNTWECGGFAGSTTLTDCQTTNVSLAPTQVTHWLNNHCIANSCVNVTNDPNYTYTEVDSLIQSVSQASAQGYTAGSTFAMTPTSGGGGTVSAGANEQSLCTTINGLDTTAGAACLNDTTYGVTYNATTHTVSWPARTAITRPASAAWDIGAYQFNSSQATPPTCTPGTSGFSASIAVSCTNPNAGTTVLCYSTTTTPATNGFGTGCTTGTQYSTTLTFNLTTTLKVVAGTSTLADSLVNTYVYTANPSAAVPAMFARGQVIFAGQGGSR